MMDPFSLSTGTFGTALQLAEFCLSLKEVDSVSRVFVDLIDRVRKDLDEALRVRREVEAVLDSVAVGKKAWIDGAIRDIQAALHDIGVYIESARIDMCKGKPISLKNRFRWVLNNHQKFVTSEKGLATCHHSLLGAIATMHALSTDRPLRMSPIHFGFVTLDEESIEDEPVLTRPYGRRPRRSQVPPYEPLNISMLSTIYSSWPWSMSTESSFGSSGSSQADVSDRSSLQETLCDPSVSLLDLSGSCPSSTVPGLPLTLSNLDMSDWTNEDREIPVTAVADHIGGSGGISAMTENADLVHRSSTLERRRRKHQAWYRSDDLVD
jgi:hypothetical protein